MSPRSCDPHNNSKVDVIITELLCSLAGIPLTAGARELCSFSEEKGWLPLLVWDKDGLAP